MPQSEGAYYAPLLSPLHRDGEGSGVRLPFPSHRPRRAIGTPDVAERGADFAEGRAREKGGAHRAEHFRISLRSRTDDTERRFAGNGIAARAMRREARDLLPYGVGIGAEDKERIVQEWTQMDGPLPLGNTFGITTPNGLAADFNAVQETTYTDGNLYTELDTAVGATSSTSPRRRSGSVFWRGGAPPSSSEGAGDPLNKPVSMGPGAMQLTRTLSGPHSAARLRQRA